ncbi:MAG: FlgD immunoglobulin-like domain containing protein [Candidatus Zixiibacteriota bacterium]
MTYNYPTNRSVRIEYSLPKTSSVDISVFNVMGQWVADLSRGEQPAGHHTVLWNGADSFGRPVPRGTYIFRMRANGYEQINTIAMK